MKIINNPTAQLIAKTQGVGEFANCSLDELIVGLARQSSDKSTIERYEKAIYKLIRYCAKNAHWSVFDMANIVIQFSGVPMYVVAHLLRHKSANFQQFSQRYSADIFEAYKIEMRKKGSSNRQGSLVELVENSQKLQEKASELTKRSFALYQEMLDNGVAPECARAVLPQNTCSSFAINATLRTWITLLNVRLHHHSQKETREVAELIKEILLEQCPLVAQAFNNFEGKKGVKFLSYMEYEETGKELGEFM
jgi:thymidylate synthase (FAD)